MKVDGTLRQLLKQHGFMWIKDSCTDKVAAEDIKNILPAANGFTVEYNLASLEVVLELTTAEVKRIELPEDLDETWIAVHWETLVDQRK
jgi:hypothetical protein